MLAFLILCYYYPRLPFSLQRIKRQGFQGRTMALCICQRLDKQYLCVSALLESLLLWESGCVRPPVRPGGGVSVCPPLSCHPNSTCSHSCQGASTQEPLHRDKGKGWDAQRSQAVSYRSAQGYGAEPAPSMNNYTQCKRCCQLAWKPDDIWHNHENVKAMAQNRVLTWILGFRWKLKSLRSSGLQGMLEKWNDWKKCKLKSKWDVKKCRAGSCDTGRPMGTDCRGHCRAAGAPHSQTSPAAHPHRLKTQERSQKLSPKPQSWHKTTQKCTRVISLAFWV